VFNVNCLQKWCIISVMAKLRRTYGHRVCRGSIGILKSSDRIVRLGKPGCNTPVHSLSLFWKLTSGIQYFYSKDANSFARVHVDAGVNIKYSTGNGRRCNQISLNVIICWIIWMRKRTIEGSWTGTIINWWVLLVIK